MKKNKHYYTYKNKRVKYSVTQFVGQKHAEFDKENISAYVAKRDKISQELKTNAKLKEEIKILKEKICE